MSTKPNQPAAGAGQAYVVREGKKGGASREVRPESAFDKYCTVTRVHGGDAILNDNWHTNEVFSHVRNNFEGNTFVVRTLEAWGAVVESDRRAYYTAGGGCWTWSLRKARRPACPGITAQSSTGFSLWRLTAGAAGRSIVLSGGCRVPGKSQKQVSRPIAAFRTISGRLGVRPAPLG
jgi:hypothetical protein